MVLRVERVRHHRLDRLLVTDRESTRFAVDVAAAGARNSSPDASWAEVDRLAVLYLSDDTLTRHFERGSSTERHQQSKLARPGQRGEVKQSKVKRRQSEVDPRCIIRRWRAVQRKREWYTVKF